ncbi:alpha/beta fold hydrolase [Auraticoccus monumenti]|uniref:Alpha/beta hydrolase fold n=1 Tax=Auraticoccus monumenti TaxID=675864 RepID=A0A1G7CEZ6_9ACTN|nr:alpha/beta fold hydrolase [Auraticoccus monumenti]SDE37823.1 alpha/beta hydrolase fold [Auraticoccus monumenti]
MTTVTEYLLPGMAVREHELTVPLDHDQPDGEAITVFVRELCDPVRRGEDLPLLLHLQGGPGGKGPRPVDRSGFLEVALEHYRVVLLDQRGTGRSTFLDGERLTSRGSAEEQARYLSRFLADSIVADAELVRHQLYGGRRWATIGQSYGGFLTLVYLSRAPEALTACYVTGGIPGVPPRAQEVYRRTFPRVREKVARYYRRYPADVDRVAAVADRLAEGDVRLPDGDRLSVRRFQSVGIDLGMGPGAERLHWLVDEAFVAPGRLGADFLQQVQTRTSQVGSPLFWSLQESIYGSGEVTTGWAAETERASHPDFDPDARPLLFTGEMAFPWMFEEVAALRPFAAAVDLLAARTSWPELYDTARLAANEVPVAAMVYHDDMFVDAGLSLQTLAGLGNAEAWISNEWEHDGLGDPRVLRGLRERVAARGGELR